MEKNEEYYEKLDKRSKEYKEYKKAFEEKNSVGLGDIVEKVTKATGIKKVVEAITDDCGCEERKERLNATRLKRRKPYRCFTEDEYNILTNFFEKGKVNLTGQDIDKMIEIEAGIYNKKYSGRPCTQCGREVHQIYDTLKLIYENY